MLWCLFRTASLHVQDCRLDEEGEAILAARLRLEPSEGGDVEEHSDGRRVVVQLKSRPDCGTWSLREVVEDVLPDLYKAVDPQTPQTEYRLVTEGRMGRWLPVYRFFQSLRKRGFPEGDLLAALDDTNPIPFQGVKGRQPGSENGIPPFWTAEQYTERTLFERIVAEVRERPAIAKREESVDATRRNVWHLLANLRFVEGQTEDYLRKEMDSLLLALVGFDTQVAEKRDAMLTGLARRAAQGNCDIDSSDFLAAYGLDCVPLTQWLTLRERSRKHLEGELDRRGYKASEDVRVELARDMAGQEA
jgi:hypothetical protein